MNNVSTAAKIAVIPTAAVALLTMRWAVHYTFALMLWLAVIAGILWVLQSAKAKRNGVQQHDDAPTTYTLGQATRYGLPQAQPQQQSAARSIADAIRRY